MDKTLQLLIIEDSESDAQLLVRLMRRGGYEVHHRRVDSAEGLGRALDEGSWDLILSDHNMPNFSSFAALEQVRAREPDLPFLVVSGSIGEEVAVAAMKAGAQDYLMKGNLTRLVAAVERELRDAAERKARKLAERALLAREEELRLAREVQQQLFPAASPATAGFDIAGASIPAEATGGDYFDFVPGPEGEISVIIGDVTGHGLGSALLMADVRAYLRALILTQRSPGQILTQANRLLATDLGTDRFVTLVFATLAPGALEVDYINAGHPSGYLIGAEGAVRHELAATAPALGLNPEAVYGETRYPLRTGDMLVLVTDGLQEARSPADEEFGRDRVLGILQAARHKPSSEVIQHLFSAVRQFTGHETFSDDITAVVIKCLRGNGENRGDRQPGRG
jgi:serine phosphatase RsbU (regulator of sigma subunit)